MLRLVSNLLHKNAQNVLIDSMPKWIPSEPEVISRARQRTTVGYVRWPLFDDVHIRPLFTVSLSISLRVQLEFILAWHQLRFHIDDGPFPRRVQCKLDGFAIFYVRIRFDFLSEKMRKSWRCPSDPTPLTQRLKCPYCCILHFTLEHTKNQLANSRLWFFGIQIVDCSTSR